MRIEINPQKMWNALNESHLSAKDVIMNQYLAEQRVADRWKGKSSPELAPTQNLYTNNAPLPCGLRADISILRKGDFYISTLDFTRSNFEIMASDQKFNELLGQNLGKDWVGFGGGNGMYLVCGEPVFALAREGGSRLRVFMGTNGTVETPFGDLYFAENMGLLSMVGTKVANSLADYYQGLNPNLDCYKNRDITISL